MAIPFAASRPKSSRITRGGCVGNPTPGIVVTTAFTVSGATALPSARRGWQLAGGASPWLIQREVSLWAVPRRRRDQWHEIRATLDIAADLVPPIVSRLD